MGRKGLFFTHLKSRRRAWLVRRLHCVCRIPVYCLFPVYGGARWRGVAGVRLSESPRVRAVHVFWLVGRPHVSHVRGVVVVSGRILPRVIHWRAVTGVVRGIRGASRGRPVETGGHVRGWTTVVHLGRGMGRGGGRVVAVVIAAGMCISLRWCTSRTLSGRNG